MTKKLEEYSREELIEEIKALKRRKKFGLVWEDKKEDIVEKCKNEIPVLKEVPELAINEKPGEPTNLIIEGDNFASLQVLNYAHHGKIDVIYIDPPYNTGNKDFIYNDSYVDSEDSFRHSKWLSFMDRRLRLAKELLSDDGYICISLDDNECYSGKMLCDEIFGEKNFIANFIWAKNSGNNNSIAVSVKTEYMLVYAKNTSNITHDFFAQRKEGIDEILNAARDAKNSGESVNVAQERIREILSSSSSITGGTKQYKYVDDDYRVFRVDNLGNPSSDAFKKPEYTYELINPYTKKKCTMPKRGWLYKEKDMLQKINENRIFFESEVPGLKRFLDEQEFGNYSSLIVNNDLGNRDLEKIMGEKEVFSHPKPVSLIKFLCAGSPKNDSIILDFFAGSGTTGQAVLELNGEDGGARKFILCTHGKENEKSEVNISRDITYPRIKTVVTGIRPDGSKYSDGISANVRYFTTDFIEKGITGDVTRAKLFEKSDEMIQVRENAFEFVDKNDNYTFYKNNEKFVAIIKDPFNFGPIWYELEERNTEKLPVKLYVFSYSNYTFEDEIPDTDLKYEICAIPNSIMEVYRKISDKKEER